MDIFYTSYARWVDFLFPEGEQVFDENRSITIPKQNLLFYIVNVQRLIDVQH